MRLFIGCHNGYFMFSSSVSTNSISGSSATIFAYLGEFHSSQNRSKVLMAASFIYGFACNYLPMLGFLILNRTFRFHIPLFDIEFKPWRLYLLLCGLPSLVSAIILLIYIPESPKFTFSKVSMREHMAACWTTCRQRNVFQSVAARQKYWKLFLCSFFSVQTKLRLQAWNFWLLN